MAYSIALLQIDTAPSQVATNALQGIPFAIAWYDKGCFLHSM
jgi:hypothetical protein